MKISKRLQTLLLGWIVFFTIALAAPLYADNTEPVTGPDGHLKQTMECEWAILNEADDPDPESYVNDPADELVQLAASLDYDPVKIYNWVYKNIYCPQYFYDSIKTGSWSDYYESSRLGARMTFINKKGNPWDQSSLLIALLRISKIPARYVQLTNTDLVYVEAWVDQDNYNGSGTQKGWVPLVPWFKKSKLVEGIDLYPTDGSVDDPIPAGLDFDFNGYLESVKYKSAVELYEQQLQAHINTNYPQGTSLKDVPFKEEIIDNTGSVLPRALPVDFRSQSETRFAEIPDANRKNIRILIKKSDNTTLLDYTLYLPNVAGKKFCLDWLYTDTQYTPVFKIDSEIVLQSTTSLAPEDEFYIQYQISGWPMLPPRPNRSAGTYIHMGFDPLSANPATIEKAKKDLQTVDASKVLNPSTHEEYLGLMGQLFVETYLNRLEENSKRVAGLFYGTVTFELSPTFIYTKPHSDEHPILMDTESKFYYHPQWNIDAHTFSYFVKRDKETQTDFLMDLDAPIFQTCRWLIGYGASYDEGRIFEDWMDTPGASTIRGLMVANEDINNTGNKMIELVETDIIEETNATTSGFESMTVLPDYDDQVSPSEALDGFHFLAFWRTPDRWSPQQGFVLDANAVDGNYAIRAWTHQATILRGTKFTLNSIKVSGLIDGARYRFKGYRGSSTTPSYNDEYTVNVSPRTISFNWTGLNRITITEESSDKGPIVLENLNYTRTEYLPDLDNQTEYHLGYSSIFSLVGQLRNEARVITPIQLVNYAGTSGDIRIVHSPGSDSYFFGMDNGGAADPNTSFNKSKVLTNSFKFDSSGSSTPIEETFTSDNAINVNNNSTAYVPSSDVTFALVNDAGDPVDMVKGEFYTEEHPDFHIKSLGFNLSIRRQYKSRLVYNGPFGFGWTWNHSERIMPLEDDGVLYYDNKGNALEITKESGSYVYPKGSRFQLEKTVDGYTVTQNQSQNKSYFSNDGYLIKKEDPFGNFLVYEYTNAEYPNRITKITDSLGRDLDFEYNANGQVTKVTDFWGRYCSYAYTGDDLTSFTDLEGNVTTFQYLSGQENEFNNHNMTKYTLPNGDWLEIGYYKNDQVAYHTNTKGETFNFMYSRLNRYAETWNEEGYYRKVFFNEYNDVIRISTEDGSVETMDYDSHHNKITHTDGNGNTTYFQYYPDGTAEDQQDTVAEARRLYVKTDALGNTWQYEYDSANNPYAPSQITDAKGNVTRFVYNADTSLQKKIQAPGYEHDSDGLLVANAQSPGLETLYQYDTVGNVLKITSPDLKFVTNTYDEDNLYLTATKDKNGNDIEYDYYKTCSATPADWKAIGSLKSKTVMSQEDSFTTTYAYNLYGQVKEETNPLQGSTVFEYDDNRKLISKTAPNSAVTTYEYEPARDIVTGGKLARVIDPEGHIESYTYDQTGNLIAKTDKNGNITQYVYDAMSRPIGEINALDLSEWLTYDGAGNVIEKIDKNGNATSFEYDAVNRLVKTTTPEGNEQGFFSAVEYDANGNKTLETDAAGFKTKYQYDVLNRVIAKTIGFESGSARTYEYRYDNANKLIKEIAPMGNFTVFEYDSLGNLTAQKDYDLDGTTLLRHTAIEYYSDARNLIKQKTIINGYQTASIDQDIVEQFQYDALGRKIQYIDPNGGITRYSYDAVGNLIKIADPNGNITTNTYDKNNRIVLTTTPLGHTSSILYDGMGNVSMARDALGNETRIFYDAAGRKIGTEDALGYITTIDYDANGNIVAVTDPKGNTTTSEYDMDNRKVSQTDALGNQTVFQYDGLGRVTQETSAKNIITQMAYNDPSGQITQTVQAQGTLDEVITDFAYNDNSLLSQKTDAAGISVSYIYDGLDRVIWERKGMAIDGTTTLPSGSASALETFVSYYPTGKVKTQTDAKSLVTLFEYDGIGNLVKETDPVGNDILRAYDANNNLVSVTYPGNVIDTYKYDAQNRVVLKTEKGVETQLGYDANNQLVSQTKDGVVDTTFAYDALGRLTEKTQGLMTAEQSTIKYGYDSNSNLVFITNSLNKTIFYEYDALNRRIFESKASDLSTSGLDPDSINYGSFDRSKAVAYNAVSSPETVTRAEGSAISYEYDSLERTIQVKHDGTIRQEFAYDALSRMIEAVDHNQGALTQTVLFDHYNLYHQHTLETQGTRQVQTTQDANGNTTHINYTSGNVITQTFTDNNQIQTITDTSGTLAQMTQYNGLGSLKQMTLGNGIQLSVDYDAHNREILREYSDGINLYSHEIQSRDDQGNILTEQIITASGTTDKTYTYDALERISSATQTAKPDLSWTYDLEGNWLETNQNGTAETRTVDNDNQYDSITGLTPAYDANGNMTGFDGKTYVYDWANRLIQVKQSSIVQQEYFYDALNRRVQSKDYTGAAVAATEYVYHGSRVIEEYKDGSFDKAFVYADYMDDPVCMMTGGSTYYYIKDRQFSIKALADSSGNIVESYAYSAYGVMTIFDSQDNDITATGSAVGNPYGYTGRRWDGETGLWYYRNRMYSPVLGRFMQKDPAGFVDGLNLYAYVMNNPLMYLDPDGLTSMTYDLDYGGSLNTEHEITAMSNSNMGSSAYSTSYNNSYSASQVLRSVASSVAQTTYNTISFANDYIAAPLVNPFLDNIITPVFDHVVEPKVAQLQSLASKGIDFSNKYLGTTDQDWNHLSEFLDGTPAGIGAKSATLTMGILFQANKLKKAKVLASQTKPKWKQYEMKHGGQQTTMKTTFQGKDVTVRLDKPPTDSTIVDFKDYDWSKSAYDKPFMQDVVTKEFQTQISKYKTIRPNVHLQFSNQPPSWVEQAIKEAGGTYSVKQ